MAYPKPVWVDRLKAVFDELEELTEIIFETDDKEQIDLAREICSARLMKVHSKQMEISARKIEEKSNKRLQEVKF